MIVATDSGALIGWGESFARALVRQKSTCEMHQQINSLLTFFSLNMCLLPFPLVDTFFSDAGALYLVLRSRADRLWISCLDWWQDVTKWLSRRTFQRPQCKWLTCFPPPLLGWMLEMMEGPAGPPLLLLPVQLLQRISPWLPFFHMDEEFVLHTAQHGFKPSGIVAPRSQAQHNEALGSLAEGSTSERQQRKTKQMRYLRFWWATTRLRHHQR